MRQLILDFFTSTTAPRYLSAGGGWKVELLGSVAVAVDIGEILVVQVRVIRCEITESEGD